ncbi:MAG: hypothetical protein IPL46_09800 [Saprospiraceae bacterium]|nr:hypothetical protein [Saprospiraceae bacterium]
MRQIIWVVFVLWITIGAVAQRPLQFSFQQFSTSDGLSSNQTNTVVQDRNGYLWIGTTDGLQRYDGIRYRSFKYQPDDSTSLPSNPVLHLQLDHKGRLWVLMADGRVGIFDTERFQFKDVSVKTENGNGKHERSRGIIRDHDGNIFLLLERKELYVWSETSLGFSKAFAFLPQTAEWRIESFAHQPGTKKYWFGLFGGGFAVYNALTRQVSYSGHNLEKETFIDHYKDVKTPYNLYFDKSERLWFMDWPEFVPYIYCWDLRQSKPLLERAEFNSTLKTYVEVAPLFEEKDGTIWAYGAKVLARYNQNQGIFEHVENGGASRRGIDFSVVTSLFEDREHNIWLATSSNGLFRFNPSQEFFTNIKHHNRNTGLRGSGSPMSFVELKDRSIIVGVWGDGLYRYDQDWNQLPINFQGVDIEHVSIWSMFESKDSNTIWMAGQASIIIRYDQKKFETKSYFPEILQGRTIRQLVEDHNGNLWLGTQGRGVYKWNTDKGQDLLLSGPEKYQAIPNTTINHISVDSKGNIWIATQVNGVYVIDPTTNSIVDHLALEGGPGKKIPEEGVSAVLEYDDSLTIISTATYIVLYNQNDNSTSILATPGSLSGYLTAMEKDHQGYLWFTTSNGLYRMNFSTKMMVRFDRRDGLEDEYFTMASSYRLGDARMIFGASEEFVSFQPQRIQLDGDSVNVSITGLQVMNKQIMIDSLSPSNPIKLTYKQNALSIEYSPLTYLSLYKVKYKMEGLEEEWQTSSNYRAVYSYLPPGEYTFKLFANDSEGRPGKMSSIQFELAPPFWATWWFYSLIALVFLSLLYWFDSERLKRKEAV